ncbi:MAG: hypothetical protein II783_05085 [Erysipelotrichales bacterium]|nr:hypothetical protein [Erysipelotrichales bacterium]
MKRWFACFLALAVLFLGGCSVKDTSFFEPPQMEVRNGVDSGTATDNSIPAGTYSWVYYENGEKHTEESDNRVFMLLEDPYDRATGIHSYNLWFGLYQIPDSVEIWVLNEQGKKGESAEFFWDKERGVCQVFIENGKNYCVKAQWARKHYAKRGYYGSAVYYFSTYFPKYAGK